LDIYTPFRISNSENVSTLSLKTPPDVGVSNEKLYKPSKKMNDVDTRVVIDMALRNVSIIDYSNTTNATQSINKNTTVLRENYGSDDAALIPISHLSKHHNGL